MKVVGVWTFRDLRFQAESSVSGFMVIGNVAFVHKGGIPL